MRIQDIYLAGAIKNVADSVSWREKAAERLRDIESERGHVQPIVPSDYFSYEKQNFKTQKQIKQYYLQRILHSTLVLVNLNDTESSVGTAQELQFAIDNKIPVIGFGTERIYPWCKEDCDVVFDTLDEALDYIIDYFLL